MIGYLFVFVPVEGDPLFERPKGVIANQVEENGKAKAVPAAVHQVTVAFFNLLSLTEAVIRPVIQDQLWLVALCNKHKCNGT